MPRKFKRPIVYIAGPFRAARASQMAAHILTAQAAAVLLCRLGCSPYTPHANLGHGFGHIREATASAVNDAFLSVAEAIYLLPGWRQSVGTLAEVETAMRLGLPRLQSPAEVRVWRKQR